MTRPRGMGIFASIVQACHDMPETTLKATLLGKKKNKNKQQLKVTYMFQ